MVGCAKRMTSFDGCPKFIMEYSTVVRDMSKSQVKFQDIYMNSGIACLGCMSLLGLPQKPCDSDQLSFHLEEEWKYKVWGARKQWDMK